jgi:O-antigen ligase
MAWIAIALAFAVLFFMPGLLQQFDVPKIEAVRVCGFAALAASLIAGRAGRPRRWRLLDVAVVAWLGVEIVTTIVSESPRVSLLGEPRQREGLLTSAALAGLYFAARDAFGRAARMRAMLDLALGLAAIASLYALAQAAGLDPVQWTREARSGGFVRPFGTLGHPNLLGVVTASLASVAVALAIAGRRGLRTWGYALAALLSLAATELALSRAAWLAVAVALPVAAGLALRERSRDGTPARAAAAAAGVLLVLVAVSLFVGREGPVAARLGESIEGGSAASRLEIWRTAIAAWLARPWVGHGPDLFEMVFPRYQTPVYWRYEWTGLPSHAHSIYLHTLATRGVLGALAGLLWAVALAGTARSAWRARVAPGAVRSPDLAGLLPAAIAMVLAVALAGAFGAIGITGALLLVTGSAAIAGMAEAAGPAKEAAVSRGRRWAARLAAGVAAAVVFLGCFGELRASRAASAAEAWMTSAPPRAVEAARFAVALAPLDDRMWRILAQTQLWSSVGSPAPRPMIDEAVSSAERAVALAPMRAENHVILARALGSRESAGDSTASAAARSEFERSMALAPMDALTLMEYADHESLLGRAGRALPLARRAVALYPGEGAARATLARAWAAADRPDSARAELALALAGTWHDAGERRDAERMLADLEAPPPAMRAAGAPRAEGSPTPRP